MTRPNTKPAALVEKIQDLEPSDEAFIINGNRTRAKAVEVISAQDGIIKVRWADERGEHLYDFDAETGSAVRSDEENEQYGIPYLTVAGDERLRVIQERQRHRDFRTGAEAPINAFNKAPTQENFDTLMAYMGTWGEYSIGLDLTSTIGDLAGEPQPDTTRATASNSVVAQQHNTRVSQQRGAYRPGF